MKRDPSAAGPAAQAAATSARKVVFVNRFFHPDHSATSQLLSDLAFHLAASGMAVEVVTSRLRYDDPDARLPTLERTAGVQVRRVWSTCFGRRHMLGRAVDYLSFYLSATLELWRVADSGTVVVAKTDPPLVSIAAAPVAHWRGAVLVNWLQDLFPEVAASLGVPLVRGPLLNLLRRARNASLRAACTNVVLGERMHARVRAEGVPSDRISVVHNWADGQAIPATAPQHNALRSEWGLGDRFVVGYSGNLGRAHEFQTFLDAADRLQHDRRIALLFIGSGAQRPLLEAEIRRRELGNVYLQPYQPREILGVSLGAPHVHLVSLNPALEGLIVPSKFYGIAAAGRPVLFVGDLAGEIPAILTQAECGFAVRSGDGAGLAEKISLLASDAQLCRRLGENARRSFDARFESAIAFGAWKDLLRQATPR